MLKSETRDELLLTAASAAAFVLDAVASGGKVSPMARDLLLSFNQLMSRAGRELAEGGPAMQARRTSKYVQDAAFPRIVCLCGPTSRDMADAQIDESSQGKVVLSIFDGGPAGLHLAKIDLADEILVVNRAPLRGVDQEHVAYARAKGKRVRFTDEAAGLAWFEGKKAELDQMAGRFG